MSIKLDPGRLEQLIKKADDQWFKDHTGQYRYEEHVKFTSEFIVRHYSKKMPERKTHAVTNNKHRGGKKVPQPKMRLRKGRHR